MGLPATKHRQLVGMMKVLPKDKLWIGLSLGHAKYGRRKEKIGISAHSETVNIIIAYKGRRAYLPIHDYVAAAMEAIERKLKKMTDTENDPVCPKCGLMLDPFREGGEEGSGPWHYTCTGEECDFSAFDYELED